MARKWLLCVVGPTAIGKTKLAISLAEHFQTEIISADSRQFYKEMTIGTAVPTPKELSAIKHHFIQHKSIQEHYSVGDFEKEALDRLHVLFKKHDVVILVGGSGLYVDAVINGLDEFPEIDPVIRMNLRDKYNTEGLAYLQKELKLHDPMYYEQVDIENPHRVIRALEVCISASKPYSSFLNKKKEPRSFNSLYIGLNADRSVIYDRINKRVDKMMASGLLLEAKSLWKMAHLNALQTVGYKELFLHLDGTYSLEQAIEEIKKNTRRFAKRQLTWYRKNDQVLWFDYEEPISSILENITSQIKNRRMTKKIFYIMGVSGTGKTTIGQLLAKTLNMPFFDGDDFHSSANIAKMASGQPLNDDDRKSWLLDLNQLAKKHQNAGAVIACSALKKMYRDWLKNDISDSTAFVFLEGTFEEVKTRLRARKGHFMPINLLQSQFDTLEPPIECIKVKITNSPTLMVEQIIKQIT